MFVSEAIFNLYSPFTAKYYVTKSNLRMVVEKIW